MMSKAIGPWPYLHDRWTWRTSMPSKDAADKKQTMGQGAAAAEGHLCLRRLGSLKSHLTLSDTHEWQLLVSLRIYSISI